VALIDKEAPCRFLQTAFEPSDWIAVFLKNYRTGQTAQQVVSLERALSLQFQRWLRNRNADRWNVYVSVNSLRPGRSRTRDAVLSIRHVFLEEDADGPGLLAALTTRPDVPPPSYVLHSSRGRVHVFWRVRGFSAATVERIQKRLAIELRTDPAATSCAQTTRLPGFANYKRETPCAVTLEYLRPSAVLTPNDFPRVKSPPPTSDRTVRPKRWDADRRVTRARQFLQSVQPAVSGRHGDLHTFRICCRLVRGFDLSDDEALSVMSDWNERCQPPWPERELLTKVHNARRYGREPWGGLLRSHT
jgi:hypothetical protein